MKIVVIGDIHGRSTWKDIIEVEADADKVVFMGDYVDSFDIGVKKQIKNFLEIIELKKSEPDKYVLLFGNHEYHYLPHAIEGGIRYSGFRSSTANKLMFRLSKWIALKYIQMCYIHDDYLFSHAGISSVWLKNHHPSIESLNTIFRNTKEPWSFGFQMTNDYDPYGNNVWQSPLWIRPDSLNRSGVSGYNQVVGHTEMNDILITPSSDKNFNIFVDTLNVNRYLVIDNGNPIKKEL